MKYHLLATDENDPDSELDLSHTGSKSLAELPVATRTNVADKASYSSWLISNAPMVPFRIAPYDNARQTIQVWIIGNCSVLIGKQQDLLNAYNSPAQAPISGGVILSGTTLNIMTGAIKFQNNEELWAFPYRNSNISYVCIAQERWLTPVTG